MTKPHASARSAWLSRRGFMVMAGSASCAIAFADRAIAAPRSASAVNAWVTLHPDGAIDIICPGLELGQGAHSTLPRFLAEELDADWSAVRVVAAPLDETVYGNPLFWGMQLTAGSRTTLGYADVMRIAGAQARYVLMSAAARRWKAPIDQLTTSDSVVTHAASARTAAYGELLAYVRVPKQFPPVFQPDYIAQVSDDFFGDPPPPLVTTSASARRAIRLKSPAEFKLVGKDGPRLDIPDKVNGRARYGIDMQAPHMVYAMIQTAPVPSCAPLMVDDAAARAVPGVLDVVKLPSGVAVVGDTIFAARDGRSRLKVTWSPAPAPGYDSAAVMRDFGLQAGEPGPRAVRAFSKGDPASLDQALTPEGDKLVFAFQGGSELIYHAPIEPQNATVALSADGSSADVWVGTQWPKLERDAVAKAAGLKPEQVRVHTLYAGGSFGRRQEPGAAVDAAYVARAVGRPVKVIWTREDDIKRNPFRQALVTRAEAAVAPDGAIVAMRHRVVADSWFARMFPDWFEQYHHTDPGNWVGGLVAYDVPLQAVDNVTDRRQIDVCYMRGIGVAQVKFAQETLIDNIARHLGKDPVAYRLQLLHGEPRGQAVVKCAAQMADWSRPREGRALGFAYTPYSNGHAALAAEVSVDRATGEISVHEAWCAVDVGFAVQPAIIESQMEGGIVQALSIAILERVTVKDGAVQPTNFHQYPILRMSKTPAITVKVLSTPHPIAGAGEIGMMQIAPAVNNAVARLIGRPLEAIPMLPADVLAASRA